MSFPYIQHMMHTDIDTYDIRHEERVDNFLI